MSCLETDLYQLTMAAGFWQAGKTQDRATFELFVRRLPANRDFLIAAGLHKACAFARSRRPRRTRSVHRWLRRHKQYGDRIPVWRARIRDRGALVRSRI